MSDLLSASSLLMAISAILFGLCYSEIMKALGIVPRQYKEDNKKSRQTVSDVLFIKAIPVSVMAIAVALIFLPGALQIVKKSYLAYSHDGFAAFEQYDAVRTAYCFVTVISGVLAGYMGVLVVKLWSLRKRLS